MNNEITITWQAFGNPTSATIDWSSKGDTSHEAMLNTCAKVYEDTNKYEGTLWTVLEPFLPHNRTHTALSVGDTVTVNGIVFKCEPMGWSWGTGAEQDSSSVEAIA